MQHRESGSYELISGKEVLVHRTAPAGAEIEGRRPEADIVANEDHRETEQWPNSDANE